MTKKSEAQAHFFAVDALRGLAALGVVLFHVRVSLWKGWWEVTADGGTHSTFDRVVAWLSMPTPFLGYGVMLFFVLSGFCIHWPNAGTQKLKLFDYMWRRLLRIYPPYLAALLLTWLAEHIGSEWWGLKASTDTTFAKSIFMVQNYGSDAGQMAANPSLWSLPVEVELYLVYPLVFWLWLRLGSGRVLCVVAVVSIAALALCLTGQDWIMNNFAKYWIIWCFGAWLAGRAKAGTLPLWRWWCWASLGVALVACGWAILAGLPHALTHFVGGLASFFIVWGALSARDLPDRLGERLTASLQWLGRISYSLYLVHFPFFILCGAAWVNCFGAKPANYLVTLAFVPPCLLLAHGFHLLVEAPSHHWARAVNRSATERPK